MSGQTSLLRLTFAQLHSAEMGAIVHGDMAILQITTDAMSKYVHDRLGVDGRPAVTVMDSLTTFTPSLDAIVKVETPKQLIGDLVASILIGEILEHE